MAIVRRRRAPPRRFPLTPRRLVAREAARFLAAVEVRRRPPRLELEPIPMPREDPRRLRLADFMRLVAIAQLLSASGRVGSLRHLCVRVATTRERGKLA